MKKNRKRIDFLNVKKWNKLYKIVGQKAKKKTLQCKKTSAIIMKLINKI